MINTDFIIKRYPHARHLRMRIDNIKKTIVITAPKSCQQKTIDEFIKKSQAWLIDQRHKLTVPALPNLLTLNGQKFSIDYIPINSTNTKQNVMVDDNHIYIYGDINNYKYHLITYLKNFALHQAILYVEHFAKQLTVEVNKIAVKEYKARWGCCYKRGDVLLAWRLIMAPIDVFKYVCAHETAHLIHHDHSSQFWRIVATLDTDYQSARKWLRDHGQDLFTII